MKFFFALIALCAVFALAAAEPRPVYTPYNPYSSGQNYGYGGGYPSYGGGNPYGGYGSYNPNPSYGGGYGGGYGPSGYGM